MLEGIDVKIGWAAEFLSGNGLAGLISCIALIGIAIRLKNLEKISLILVQHERTTEENTDALIEATKEKKALRKSMEKMINADFKEL